ncbi:MAG: phage holin family protein [Fournierella sp.]|uniref:phage holin family protein n=1 Tax=Allofournierella sp. TaxID=1940256 RepID=UPI002A81C9D5|nr:phage holin family protein [Fournierella sp.]MDY4166137.1 phage holin family protein [Fournierella sp.]
MEIMGITGVAGIVVICYLVGLVVKATPWNNNKIIPIVCGMAGAVLGVAGMYVMPEFPAADPITAVAVGIVSGLAATGADQAVKQLKQ